MVVLVLLCGCGNAANGTSDGSSPSSLFVAQNTRYAAANNAQTVVTSPNQSGTFLFSDSAGGESNTTVALGAGSTETSGFFYTLPGDGYAVTFCWNYNYNSTTHTLYLGSSDTSPDPQASCNAVVNYTEPLIQS